jgi:hypothetical protein
MSAKKTTRRQFLKSTSMGMAALALSSSIPNSCQRVNKARSNVVLIYTDDQNFEHIGCYGGAVYTPRIDALAKDGVRFTRAYVTTAICTPSRYSLITGQYPGRCSHPRFKKKYPRWKSL